MLLKNYDYNLTKVVPYILVLVLALLGVNVIIVLIRGTLLAGIIGLIDGSFGWMGLLDAVSKGIISMEDIAMIRSANWWFSRYYSTQWWY